MAFEQRVEEVRRERRTGEPPSSCLASARSSDLCESNDRLRGGATAPAGGATSTGLVLRAVERGVALPPRVTCNHFDVDGLLAAVSKALYSCGLSVRKVENTATRSGGVRDNFVVERAGVDGFARDDRGHAHGVARGVRFDGVVKRNLGREKLVPLWTDAERVE